MAKFSSLEILMRYIDKILLLPNFVMESGKTGLYGNPLLFKFLLKLANNNFMHLEIGSINYFVCATLFLGMCRFFRECDLLDLNERALKMS